MASTVVGIVTNRDLRFETRLDAPVREIMTPRERLVWVREGASPEEGKALMHQHRLERVLVVNDAFELRGLMTVKDITKQTDFPMPRATPRASCVWARRWAWVKAPRSGSNCW
jgi:IMP dehydrogenase